MTILVRYPPPPFLSLSPLESIRSGGVIPTAKRVSQRYLRDTTRKQGKMAAIPPLRYYLEKVLRDMGGISHWATKIEVCLCNMHVQLSKFGDFLKSHAAAVPEFFRIIIS